MAIAVIVSSLNGGVNGLLHLSIYKVKLNYFWKKINLYPANPSPEAKRVLVAPLDWGLGHATRCIPLIRSLLDAGCEVLIGAEDRQAALLEEEFPQLIVLPLPGYRIIYPQNGKRLGIKIIRQLPKILGAIRYEQGWLREMVKKYAIDAVIADNRYGLHHPRIPAILLTHQLGIRSPFGRKSEKLLQLINYLMINKFTECWVVDLEGNENLAGALSHPEKLPGRLKYLGCLSRFERMEGLTQKYDLLLLLSGPEPQRTEFEKMMVQQISGLPLNTLIVGGEPGKPYDYMLRPRIRHVHHLNAADLSLAIQESGIVISRSGYTTLMDLVKLRKKAIIVPTPGQTEQEYLGKYLMEKGIFYSVPQENFNLQKALEAARHFPFQFPEGADEMKGYQRIVHEFVASL